MTYLRDLLPVLTQGLAGATAGRDAGGVADAIQAGRDVRTMNFLAAVGALPRAVQGQPYDLKTAIKRHMLLPEFVEGAKRLNEVRVNPVMQALPAGMASTLEYMSPGSSATSAVTTGLGHAAGATLADAIVKSMIGSGTHPGHLAVGRALGGLGGQTLGRLLGRSFGGGDESAS